MRSARAIGPPSWLPSFPTSPPLSWLVKPCQASFPLAAGNNYRTGYSGCELRMRLARAITRQNRRFFGGCKAVCGRLSHSLIGIAWTVSEKFEYFFFHKYLTDHRLVTLLKMAHIAAHLSWVQLLRLGTEFRQIKIVLDGNSVFRGGRGKKKKNFF